MGPSGLYKFSNAFSPNLCLFNVSIALFSNKNCSHASNKAGLTKLSFSILLCMSSSLVLNSSTLICNLFNFLGVGFFFKFNN